MKSFTEIGIGIDKKVKAVFVSEKKEGKLVDWKNRERKHSKDMNQNIELI